MKVESRCGLLCGGCEYRESMGCAGCVNIEKPFHGACPEFPCEQLHSYAYDPEQGDNGQRLVQCRKWREEA